VPAPRRPAPGDACVRSRSPGRRGQSCRPVGHRAGRSCRPWPVPAAGAPAVGGSRASGARPRRRRL